MKRRKFIEQTVLFAGGLLIAGKHAFGETGFSFTGKKIKGRVLANGKGLQGVVVSDGYTVTITDKKGKYELEPHPDAASVFISTPAGYEFIHEKGVARHYQLIKNVNDNKETDFELKRLDRNDNEHQFFIWADPQVKNDKDVERMMNESVPDMQKWIAAAGTGTLLHGITVGDIVWDEHKYYADYDKAVRKMGIPFFQCLGNHDMDYTNGSDESSDDTFQQTYGPTYYSFNRGQVHYVVMDNVRYLGKDRNYDGFFQQNQLDWLKKDLELVPKDKLVVLCVHIPVHKGTKNNQDLYAILGERDVHIMSGHTHYHVNAINKNIYEHNHGTVCGAWWTGDICEDGTPNGYGVYTVKGKDLQWHYQSTGKSAEHQMKIFINEYNDSQKQVLVNIWNHDEAWKTEYSIDGASKGSLEQFAGFDPLAYKTMLGKELPAKRAFAEPKETKHLFKALVPADAKEIVVTATDRFGKKFVEKYKV